MSGEFDHNRNNPCFFRRNSELSNRYFLSRDIIRKIVRTGTVPTERGHTKQKGSGDNGS